MGVMCRVGDAVFGQAAGCLGSAVLCDARTVVAMPPGLTFAEAATIPTAFLTAYDCLIETARISKESRVLVHAATGALSAIDCYSTIITLLERHCDVNHGNADTVWFQGVSMMQLARPCKQ